MANLDDLRHAAKDPRPLLEAIGLMMVGKTQSAFRDQGRGGQRWQARGVPNRAGILEDLRAGKSPPERRFQDRPAGIDTGRLRSSIAYRIEGETVTIGSKLDYASDVQRGANKTISIDAGMRRALAEWLRSLSKDRRRDMRRAFGYLFHSGVFKIVTPPRPFVMVTDEDRRQIVELARKYFTGGFK